MNEPTMDKLVQRLDLMEHQNRHLKRIGSLVLVVIAAVVLMGQAKSSKVAKVIEAEKFVVRDMSGKVRAALQISAEGGPSLDLYDKNGKNRASLAILEVGWPTPILFLLDRNEKFSLKLGEVGGEGFMWLHDKDGRITWKAP